MPKTQKFEKVATGQVVFIDSKMMEWDFLKEQSFINMSKSEESDVTSRIDGLQRKCACGGSNGLSLSYTECEKKKLLGHTLRTKLHVNEPGDACEREANQVAQQVVNRPKPARQTVARGAPGRPLVQHKAGGETANQAVVPPIVNDVLSSPGQPLDTVTRLYFEHHLGHDLRDVRIHTDAKAAASAQAVNALAYTVGRDVVFGAGQQTSASMTENRLLTHELVHTVQQQIGSGRQLQRTEMMVGNRSLTVNFDHLYKIDEQEISEQIVSMVSSWTGEIFQIADIQSLDSDAKRWLVFALQLFMDNSPPDMSSDEKSARIIRLIRYAPNALYHPSDNEDFVKDVLRALNQLGQIVESGVEAPERRVKKKIKKMVAPRIRKKLDADELQRRLVPALLYYLRYKDPNKWGQEGTRSFPVLQNLGDILLDEARIFFAPYADAARANIFVQTPPWRAATHIVQLGPQENSRENLLNLMWNRAEIVGRNIDPNAEGFDDANIFEDVSYNDNRIEDWETMQTILESTLDNNEIKELVGRINQVTGQKRSTASGPEIGLSERFDATKYPTACAAHWRGIDTLCHEIIHALVHRDFTEATSKATFDQIIVEGFTEVLGVQLYNEHVLPKAINDHEFKSQIEAGVPGAPCSEVEDATVEYGDAGKRAQEILKLVGDDNFRVAYFMGRPELAGLSS